MFLRPALASTRKTGGESGIRTHVTLSSKHAFQACAFSHSAISPADVLVRRKLLRFDSTAIAWNGEVQEGLVTVSVVAGARSGALPFPDDGAAAAGAFRFESRTRLCRQNKASSRRSATPSLSYTLRR